MKFGKTLKKNLNRIAGIAMAVAMVQPTFGVVHAANYTPVAGTQCSFSKYLVMKKEANVPNVTFAYTIRPGTAIAASSGHFAVLAGVGTPTIAANQASFSPSDTTINENAVPTGETLTFKTPATDDEKYATKSVVVNFASVSFPEPGVYRYIIAEDTTAVQGITFDTDAERTLDVYVTDDAGTLRVSGYVLHTDETAPVATENNGTGDVAATGDRLADKSTGITNRLDTQNLTFGVGVTGNQASHDKYFKTKIQMTSVTPANKYKVVTAEAETAPLANAATEYDVAAMKTANNIAELTGQQLLDGYDFYLKHDQKITIQGIEKDATYTVSVTNEDYKQASAVHASETIADADITDAKITLTRAGVIPTGVIMSVAPYGLVGVAGAFGLFGIKAKRKKHNKAE